MPSPPAKNPELKIIMPRSVHVVSLALLPALTIAFGGLTHNTHLQASSSASASSGTAGVVPTQFTAAQRISLASAVDSSVFARPAQIESSARSAVPLGVTKTYNVYAALFPSPPPPPSPPSNCCKLFALGM